MKYIYSAIIAVVIIGTAWYMLDYSSGYPKSAEELLNASSTINNYSTSTAAVSSNNAQNVASSNQNTNNNQNNQNSSQNSSQKNFMHSITVETNKGTIVFETYDADAPKTVENFISLANKGFYNGTIFHRIISGFMIQGGDPTGTGMGGPGYKFQDELNANTVSYKAGYVRGTVAMANAGPNTNGSQFFIMHKDTPLPHNYTIFGRVISGMEVVDAIASEKTGANDKPVNNIVMNKVTVATK